MIGFDKNDITESLQAYLKEFKIPNVATYEDKAVFADKVQVQ